jgi:hypothetical protein
MRKLLLLLAVCLCTAFSSFSQCSTANINWDALEYIPAGGYTFATASAIANNQYFAIGKNRLNISYSGCTGSGENGTHTGSSLSYGSGDDVQYSGNGTVTLTFDAAVSNLKFSLYDIDKGQSIAITAANAGTSTPVTVAKANATSTAISVTGNTVTSNTGNESEGTNTTTVNVDVAGPVTSITLTVTNSNTKNGGSADSEFWLSDITACVTGSFPTNYYAISKPSSGMPGYVLVAVNKGVYAVNTTTGYAKLIFEDGASSGTINSVAYDPYNRIIYYTWSLTNNGSANASERTLRKYDMNTGFVSKVLDDVNSVGLPTFSQGIESGAAAFYDGSLYLGVEGGADNGNGGPKSTSSDRESIIWRIDFNSSGGVAAIAQVYGVSGDAHDWSDFSIYDGILYDFNGDATTPDYHHYNLQTGDNLLVPRVTAPKQSAVGWDGTIYWVNNALAVYNKNGNTGTPISIYSNPAIPNWGTSSAPSFGDAAEAFKPQADFGDAPSSYDLSTPAVHETVTGLRLGGSVDLEWDKPTVLSGTATEDGGDEDGLAYTQILVNGANYYIDVKVFNNTGANATLCAWIDNNSNGIFESTEAVLKTVPSSNSVQTVQMMWTPGVILPDNSYTYLRVRLTSATNNMTTSSAMGHFPDGEVEDYRIIVSSQPLAVKLTDFVVRKVGEEKANLSWSVTGEEPATKYDIERSVNSHDWSILHSRSVQAGNASASYETFDQAPYSGANYYRLKITQPSGEVSYSAIKKLVFEKPAVVQVTPNPASLSARLSVQSFQRASGHIRIVDMNGRSVYERSVVVEEGMNSYTLPVQQLPAGMYQTEVWIDTQRYTQQLVVRK